MSASLVFSFPVNVTYEAVRAVIDQHFGDGVQVIPPYIKQAVETVGGEILARNEDPSSGVEVNPAMAFASLVNGGNVNAASSADAATSTTAHAVTSDTSATLVPASSPLAPPPANVAVAPTVNAAPGNPANVDKNGLPWDARIHSDPATLTDKGLWRKKRGATPELTRQVEDELRKIAGLPNGGGAVQPLNANAGHTSKTQSHDSSGTLVFSDGNAKKAAAIAHAHRVALDVAGPQMIDDAVLDGLNNGKQTTLSPQQMEWYEVYFARRNTAFAEFMNTATVAEQPVTAETRVVGQVVGVDATGLKWDARIHANPPAFDSAGVYVQRMDVAPQVKIDVMAELRGNVAGTPSSVPDTPVSSAPVVPPAPPVAPVTVDPGSSFVEMMKWIASNQIAKRTTPAQVSEVAAMFGFTDASGVGSIALTKDRSDYWSVIVETLKTYGAQ